MAKLDNHPTVLAVRSKPSSSGSSIAMTLQEVREMCLDAGAADSGAISLERPEMSGERGEILKTFPWARTLVSIVCRMNAEPIRSPARSVANLEFHATNDEVNKVARMVVAKLALRGARASNPSVGFPSEMDGFPGKIWLISHKVVAEASGMGRMGIHRNVIHPKFGSFILLGTIVTDAVIAADSEPIDYNPCLDCKLCIAACPVGAIAEDGFNFASCYTHNYREFMGGFTDWVETIADSGSAQEYRAKVSDNETASMWQSLSFGANYKAAYCLSVCPAGEDVIGRFLEDRAGFIKETVKPLQEKTETVYVLPKSDAEDHVTKRFPHKPVKRVGAVLRPTTIAGFIRTMHAGFQPNRAAGVNAVYHFRFKGEESGLCTVTIRGGKIEVRDGLFGTCDLRITASGRSWLRFLRKETSIVWLLLTLRVRLRGDPRLLPLFGRCFAG